MSCYPAVSGYDAAVASEAEWLLKSGRMPYGHWFSVVSLDELQNQATYDAFREHRSPGKVLAALEMLVSTGHLEAGRDEFGARMFKRRTGAT